MKELESLELTKEEINSISGGAANGLVSALSRKKTSGKDGILSKPGSDGIY